MSIVGHEKASVVLFTLILCSSVLSTDISLNVFGDDVDCLPVAFGDFNSDGLIDVFVTRENGRVLDVLLASDGAPFLRNGTGMRCRFDSFTIAGVTPGDFDGDAFMDVMMTTRDDSRSSDVTYDVRILWGGDDVLNCSSADHPTVSGTVGQPMAMDYDKDMVIDLFGVDGDQRRTYWVFGRERVPPTPVKLDYSSEIRLPHSNAFLDMNADFIPDMIITTYTAIELWLGNADRPGFTYASSYEMPTGLWAGLVGQSLFLDVELSGKLYLLLPVCFDVGCLNSTVLIHDGEWRRLDVDFEDEDHNVWGFTVPDDGTYTDTITMRGGDYNMDGYPDLLVTLVQKKSGEFGTFLMENTPCTKERCSFARGYTVLWKTSRQFVRPGEEAVMSAFYDFYQDGILDFVVVQRNRTTGATRVSAFKNNLDYDTNFIKVMVLTGLKNKKVPIIIGPLGKKKLNYGTNLPGPRISYKTLSQDGMPRAGVSAQLPQSAYCPLSLPYSIFGLERTPNFVDTLTVGLSNHSKTWTQLIPNSQIVVIPSPPNDPSQWKVQLFVTPSKVIEKSAFVMTGICGFVVLIIILLHWKEKRDDERVSFSEIAETVM